ncbi:MAG: hypothetical protein AAGF11_19385 [Myxococcota bacterium]
MWLSVFIVGMLSASSYVAPDTPEPRDGSGHGSGHRAGHRAGDGPASERSHALQLEWRAPPECPGVAYVQQAFERYVGEDTAAPLRGQAQIVEEQGEYRLELQAASDHRTLRAKTCEELADAVAVILSIAATGPEAAAASPEQAPAELEPNDGDETERASVASAESRPSSSSSAPSRPVPAPESPARAPVDDRGGSGILGAVRLDGGFRYGIMPSYGGDGSLALGLSWHALRVEVRGNFWTPIETTLDAASDTRVWTTLGAVAARGCWIPRARRLEIPLCGGLELGALRVDARGSGFAAFSGHRLWAGVAAGPAIAWVFHPRLALWVGAEAVITLRRPVVEVGPTSLRSGWAAVRGFVGLEARFPPTRRKSGRPGNKGR